RPIARFAKSRTEVFTEELSLKHGVPSHVIFSDILNRVNSQELIGAFNKWAVNYVPIEKGKAVSGDGKVLASTVSDPHNSKQDFEAVVSIFCQKSGLVHAIEQYRNSKDNEIGIVRFLIEQFKDMGLVFHLDALHAQKKQLKAS
ncbi:MAG: ISAs1 family transposase, partial [Bacteroidota bacterium]